MRRYKITTGRLNIRRGPDPKSPAVGMFQRGAEFWAGEQVTKPGHQSWLSVCAENGTITGWVCEHDHLTRYVEEIPQPAAPAPALPPMPEVAGGNVAIAERLERLERDVNLLLKVAGLKA
jgi:hypothetical protein